MKLLLWRNSKGFARNPMHVRVKFSQTIFMGLLCLALFHDQYDYSEAASLASSLFFIIITQIMSHMMSSLLTFQIERPVFLREQANKMYGIIPYFVSKILIDAPGVIIAPMLFSVIVYFKIGLTVTASQFFYFYLILFLVSECSVSLGYFVSSLFDKEESAVAIAPIIMMPLILFGG